MNEGKLSPMGIQGDSPLQVRSNPARPGQSSSSARRQLLPARSGHKRDTTPLYRPCGRNGHGRLRATLRGFPFMHLSSSVITIPLYCPKPTKGTNVSGDMRPLPRISSLETDLVSSRTQCSITAPTPMPADAIPLRRSIKIFVEYRFTRLPIMILRSAVP